MIILIKLFLNSKLDLIRTVNLVKQLFRIQKKIEGTLFLNVVKSRKNAWHSDIILEPCHLMRSL